MPQVIRNTKIWAFQYKILFNLIPCNIYLHRIKRSDTDKCNRCHKLDDIIHYFCECQEVSLFWESLSKWWMGIFNVKVTFDKKTIMVGVLAQVKKQQAINIIILLAKWYIYKNKLSNSAICFYRFICDIKYFLIIEKGIAQKNNKTHNYIQLWQQVEDYIT